MNTTISFVPTSPDTVQVVAKTDCCRFDSPVIVGNVLEPWSENPCLSLTSVLGFNLVTQIMQELRIWASENPNKLKEL